MDEFVEAADRAAKGLPVAPIPLTLRDGSSALIRPIRPDDKVRLERGLDLLSPRSRFLNFHMEVERLDDEQLRYVTEIDHRDHVAWIVLDGEDPDAPGMGLGRYVRLRHAPEVAEAAITVLDPYQGRGLGTMLLAILTRTARANGITTFRNYVLADNEVMLELFDQLGASRQAMTPEVYEVDFELPEELSELPDTPAGRAMRALGEQSDTGWLLALTLPPIWSRRWRRWVEPPAEPPAAPAWPERGDLADWMDVALEDEPVGDEPPVEEPAAGDRPSAPDDDDPARHAS
jgi:GNAT superfamily N-acetyltransferase